ncbi:UvrD-helicase domain-containing protein [Deinococcus radiophilus]|uniref:UvrD-helicase domain-containing protein n=1 Tax=Deinococcus radiophilus TaxID=32062 RepID=UPI00147657B8|nr:UvrD-helicase domain-containing protein [Deinococcus radiophilus]UFA51986.1 UvrD-helicase domain-containing protein [Deinococcus radiophilus]
MSTFQPSHYQQAIFDFVRSGTGDGVVRATAGAGKTTTLVEIAKQLPSDLDAVFLAFNTHTANELRARLPRHVRACTVHSLGRRSLLDRFSQLGKRDPDTRKSRLLIKESIDRLKLEFAVPSEQWLQAEKYLQELLRFSVANLTDTKVEERVAQLAVEYNLTAPADQGLEVQCHREVRQLLRRRLDVFQEHGLYDYEDMLYLPIVLKLDIPKYDFVFVDEAQDLSAVQLELVLKAVREGGRRLFVGDERQAIYGFTGADADSLARIVERTGATVLPLSVTYRCPRSHVALAQQLAPEIEAAPGAPEGKIHVIKEAWLPRWVRRGDLVICRYTAPLVSNCLALLQQQIPAVVRGMDIGRDLLEMATQLFAGGLNGWEEQLGAYRIAEEARIRRRAANEIDAERQIAVRSDLLDSLEVLTAEVVRQGHHRLANLTEYIADFFSDKGGAPVVFSTIHRAKGKEADRVFILYPDNMPAVYARTAAAARGEACVQFVALTRAKKDLIFVEQQRSEMAVVQP